MTKIAVIQPSLLLGEVDANLKRVEALIRDANREHAPEIIVVPEAFTSPNVYSPILRTTPQPIDGRPFQLMRNLARELGVVLAGGFLSIRGKHTYGTYLLAEPNGVVHLHDKDIPTAWEQNFYIGGKDNGVVECQSLGCKVGLMSGWEWARMGTAARVRNEKVQLVLGGMFWWSMPLNWYGPLGRLLRAEHALYREQQRQLPGQVARLTGVPVAHAAHVGKIQCNTPLLPVVNWQTEMIGESQICDSSGKILVRLGYDDGEGHVAADVSIDMPKPIDPIRDQYWIFKITPLSQIGWLATNLHGTVSYRLRHRLGRFPWQSLKSHDLPNFIDSEHGCL
ncbi:carbon-nitrogen hydrolase family protein [Acinetobacter colistiniresistens]|uniref:carbon-nitrogen hydrolase family protein n=1 Tax=Acinetobacter colistiniresistens TaxID=280145 RepID=UPI00211CBE23|nr:carbon-nitrogen hydrolase family protein [Acinetobacter colistiniresistens]UUM29117.1 carbon-nitrogen hydrolase family protein [Acinetobacter colistiniresistens]